MEKGGRIYIMSNKRNGTLYIGVTSNIIKRTYQHKQKIIEGFTKKHNLTICVYYEQYATIEQAITREKKLKGWKRNKKILLIESKNPYWDDLSEQWLH